MTIAMIGKKFGKLLVVRPAPTHTRPNGRKVTRVWVRCDCGSEKIIRNYHLTSSHTVDCGCVCKAIRLKHGHTIGGVNSSEYNSWVSMKRRCSDPDHDSYQWYGGKGIRVCDRWLDKNNGFLNFSADMGLKPVLSHSIDRIDSDGNYEPNNCRWASPTEQAANKKRAARAD